MVKSKVHQDRRNKRTRSKEADSNLMMSKGETRSGSDSNAGSGRKNTRINENAQRQPPPHPEGIDFTHDLRPDNLAGENHGTADGPLTLDAPTAFDIKELQRRLSSRGLASDELKSIRIVPVGTRLQQGATYLDLKHPEQGEITATAETVAGPDNYYVPKKELDYRLWNLLLESVKPS